MVHDLPTRPIHLVDPIHLVVIERLISSPCHSPREMAVCPGHYRNVATLPRWDQVFSTLKCKAAVGVGIGSGPYRLLCRSDGVGADIAPTEGRNGEIRRGQFDSFVVACGDTIFVQDLAKAQGPVVKVTSISRNSALSRTPASTYGKVCLVPEL